MILTKENFQLVLIALALFLSCWPIYRKINKRYWIFALPYGLTVIGACIQYGMSWQKFAEAVPSSIVALLIPFPFHLMSFFVKHYNLKV